MTCPAASTVSRCYQVFNMIIWRTLENAEVLSRREVYFWFYYKFKLCDFFFLASSVTRFKLGSPQESFRKAWEKGQVYPLSPCSSFPPCLKSVVNSRVDLNEISDWHLADLNPSWLNRCNMAVLGIYQRTDTNPAARLQNGESGMRN